MVEMKIYVIFLVHARFGYCHRLSLCQHL